MSDYTVKVKFTVDGKDLVGALRLSSDEMDKLRESTGKANTVASQLNAEQKNLAGNLNLTATAIGIQSAIWNKATEIMFRAVDAVRQYIKEAALLNARHETMGIVMEVVGRNAGYTRDQMLSAAEGVRKMGITMLESRESVTKLVQANLDLSLATKLARVAQDAAVIANINSSEAFQRMIYGIQSGQIEVLRTMGINVNFEESYKKLAKQLNVTTEQLTEQEKTQSRANVVLEATTRIVGTYEAAMETAGKQINSLVRYEEDLKTLRGQVFNEALVIAVNTYTDALKGANDETRKLADDQKLQGWGRDLVTVFAHVVDQFQLFKFLIVELATPVERVFAMIKTGWSAISILGGRGSMEEKNQALANLREESEAYNQALNDRLKANRDVHLAIEEANKFFAQRDVDAARKTQRELIEAFTGSGQPGPPAPGPRPEGRGAAGVDPYTRLNASISGRIAILREELHSTEKVTEAEKLWLKIEQDIAEGTLKFNARKFAGLAIRLSEMDALEKEIALKKRQIETNALLVAGIDAAEKAREREDEILSSLNTRLSEHQQDLEFETGQILARNAAMGQSVEMQRALAVAQEKESALRKLDIEYRKEEAKLNVEALDYWERLIKLQDLYAGRRAGISEAIDANSAAKQAQKAIEQTRDSAKRLDEDLQRGLVDSIYRGFETGLSFGKNFFESLKNLAKTTVLTPVIKFLVSPLTGALTATLGSLGIPGMANAAGGAGGGGIGGIFSGGSTGTGMVGSMVGGFDSLFQQAGVSMGSQWIADIGNYGFGLPFVSGLVMAATGNVGGGIGSTLGGIAGSYFGPIGTMVGSALGGYIGSMFGGSKGAPAVSTGDLGLSFSPAGERLGAPWTTFGAGGAEPTVMGLQQRYAQAIASLGGTAAASNFYFGSNTGAGGVNPMFLLAGGAGGRSFTTGGETPLSDAALELAASRAILTALQGSQFPEYLTQYFDSLTAETMDQTAINNAIAFASSLKGLREQLTMEPLEIAQLRVTELNTALGANATSIAAWKTQFLAAIDAGTNPQAVAQWQALGQALTQIEQTANAATDALQRNRDQITLYQDAVRSAEDALRQGYERRADELKRTVDQFSAFSRGLRAFRDSLVLGDLSTLDPLGRYQEAQRQFTDISRRAQLGDVAAIEQLQGVSESFLRASRDYYASSAQYALDFASVQTALESTASVADRQVSIAQSQLTALDTQVGQLISLNTTALSIERLIGNLVAAQTGAATLGGARGTLTGTFGYDQWLATTSGAQLWASPAGAVGVMQPGQTGAEATIIGKSGAQYNALETAQWIAAARMSAEGRMQVYDAARREGVSLSTLPDLGWSDAEAWARAQGLPTFDRGGTAAPGLALVGESGPEIVRFGAPAQVFSAPQTRAALAGGNNQELTQLLREVREELREVREELRAANTQRGAIGGATVASLELAEQHAYRTARTLSRVVST